MKTIIILLSAVATLSAFAGDAGDKGKASTNRAALARMTRAEWAAYQERVRAKSGGYVVKPGTPKGCIRVFDCQNEMSFTNVASVIGLLGKDIQKFDIAGCRLADPKGDFGDARVREKADVAVFVVADDTTPPLLQAPDDGWVAINVRKLSRNLKSERAKERFLLPRYRKQLARAIVLACGGAGSNYPGNMMDVARLEDLDLIKDEFVPFDKYDICVRYLHDLGLKEREVSVYRKACEEGWAPPPTNEFQKAIWDKVHQLPTQPIKILPEKNPVKE